MHKDSEFTDDGQETSAHLAYTPPDLLPPPTVSPSGARSGQRHRHDRGPRLTPRDLVCLLWIACMYALRLDQLQRLLLRYTPEQDRGKVKPGADRLSLERTYDTLERWRILKLIEHSSILEREKLWIWPTQRGLVEARTPFRYYGGPSSVRLPHLFYVNEVRLEVEGKRPDDRWKSEREIRRELPLVKRGESRPHVPDGILYAANSKVTIIEVERFSKVNDNLVEILDELADQYKSIWYFVTSNTRRQIERRLEEFEPERRKPFVLYDLAKYGGNYGVK
jgi:hypothetical protein